MRELAMAECVVNVVLETAAGKLVRSVVLSMGRLREIDPANFQFSFQLLTRGTPAAQAALHLCEVPTSIRCRDCNRITACAAPPFECACGERNVEIASGREFSIDEIAFEDGSSFRPCTSAVELLSAQEDNLSLPRPMEIGSIGAEA